jgi:hypothetical protein
LVNVAGANALLFAQTADHVTLLSGQTITVDAATYLNYIATPASGPLTKITNLSSAQLIVTAVDSAHSIY